MHYNLHLIVISIERDNDQSEHECILDIIIIIICKFFPSVFHWSLSNSKSASLKDSSWYSDRPQQCCSLDGLGSSSDFQLLLSIH